MEVSRFSFVKFVFINPTFCVGRGLLLFQGRFCRYATAIREASGVETLVDCGLLTAHSGQV